MHFWSTGTVSLPGAYRRRFPCSLRGPQCYKHLKSRSILEEGLTTSSDYPRGSGLNRLCQYQGMTFHSRALSLELPHVFSAFVIQADCATFKEEQAIAVGQIY